MSQEKNIKDYLHLYLGCDCILVDEVGELPQEATGKSRKFMLNAYNLNYYRDWMTQVKPILRPLKDMTEDDKIEMYDSLFDDPLHYPNMSDVYKGNFVRLKMANFEPVVFAWLLSKGFDLFGLIDAGLAISKTK